MSITGKASIHTLLLPALEKLVVSCHLEELPKDLLQNQTQQKMEVLKKSEVDNRVAAVGWGMERRGVGGGNNCVVLTNNRKI